jgi:ribosomal protein S18 acetylase RimI-like enzyme
MKMQSRKSMDFQIRIMNKNDTSDMEFFDRLQLESFKTTLDDPEKYTEEEILVKFKKFDEADPVDIFDPEHSVFFIETKNGIKAGLIWVQNRDPFWRFEEKLAWIFNLHIISDFRQQGLARMLMLRAEEWAQDLGLKSIALHVLDSNSSARRLYESLAYKLVETHNESCFYEKKL